MHKWHWDIKLAGNLVTDDQSMASILNNHFSSVLDATTDAANITPHDIDTNDEPSKASGTSSGHTLLNFEVSTEGVI